MIKGFTLVELIIVIIIVGILAAVGMSQYTKVVEKSRAAEARMVLGALRIAEIAEFNEFGSYKPIEDLGVGAPTVCTSTHFFYYSVSISDGTLYACRCNTMGMGGGKNPDSAVYYCKSLAIDGTWGDAVGSGY